MHASSTITPAEFCRRARENWAEKLYGNVYGEKIALNNGLVIEMSPVIKLAGILDKIGPQSKTTQLAAFKPPMPYLKPLGTPDDAKTQNARRSAAIPGLPGSKATNIIDSHGALALDGKITGNGAVGVKKSN